MAMKGILIIAVLSLAMQEVSGQCPLTIQLDHEGGCSGNARLYITGKDTLTRIIWYKDGTALDTVTDAIINNVTTVVGGNGSGPAGNQTVFPKDIYLDKQGLIYVLEIGDVKRFPAGSTSASNGVIVAGGNGQGNGANQFDDPIGFFIDDAGNIYVADAHNNRVQKWAPGAANGITVAGDFAGGAAANQLSNPTCVFLDANGNIYVGDQGNGRIQQFAPNSLIGVTVAGGNGTGSAANQFYGIQKIALDGDGNLYVADFGNNRVQRFPAGSTGATNGVTIAGGHGAGTAANQFDFPDGLYVDTQGNVYVTDEINERVQEWAPGSATGLTMAGGNGQGAGMIQFDQPRGIYVDAAGAIYIADSFNDRIQKWTRRFGIDTSYFPSEPGVYTAVVLDTAGCIMISNPITISPASVVAVAVGATATDICAGDTIIFTASPVNGGNTPSYQWQVNGDNAGSNNSVFSSASLMDGDIVNCTMTGSGACMSTISGNPIIMTVKPSPLQSAGNDTLLVPGNSVLLHPIVDDSIRSYQWTPVTGLSDPSKPDPIAAPVSTTVYQLSVLADDGCRASAKITITVYYDLRMPNAFTPNGDGKNDVFRIPPATTQKIRSFSVYNRHGERVFRTADSGMGWDGTFRHQREPSGAYLWEVEYEDQLSGKFLRAHGTVILIR
jgi:gliding motility-associated-like protein